MAQSITDVDGLSSLASAGGLNFGNNPALTHIVLPNLTSTGAIFIINDANLTDIEFSGLNGTGGITIRDNPSLTNLDGLSTITSFAAGVYIQNNATLMNLKGLSGLTWIGADLVIEDNPQLSICCALCPILQADATDDTVIGGSTAISGNAAGCDEVSISTCTSCPNLVSNELTVIYPLEEMEG